MSKSETDWLREANNNTEYWRERATTAESRTKCAEAELEYRGVELRDALNRNAPLRKHIHDLTAKKRELDAELTGAIARAEFAEAEAARLTKAECLRAVYGNTSEAKCVQACDSTNWVDSHATASAEQFSPRQFDGEPISLPQYARHIDMWSLVVLFEDYREHVRWLRNRLQDEIEHRAVAQDSSNSWFGTATVRQGKLDAIGQIVAASDVDYGETKA